MSNADFNEKNAMRLYLMLYMTVWSSLRFESNDLLEFFPLNGVKWEIAIPDGGRTLLNSDMLYSTSTPWTTSTLEYYRTQRSSPSTHPGVDRGQCVLPDLP